MFFDSRENFQNQHVGCVYTISQISLPNFGNFLRRVLCLTFPLFMYHKIKKYHHGSTCFLLANHLAFIARNHSDLSKRVANGSMYASLHPLSVSDCSYRIKLFAIALCDVIKFIY